VLGQQTGVQDTGDPQRPPEGVTPLRQREASRIGVQMRSPPRQSAARIGLKASFDHDEPHEFGGRSA
jgi:hypothetical protein